jgi:hypothetical protein
VKTKSLVLGNFLVGRKLENQGTKVRNETGKTRLTTAMPLDQINERAEQNDQISEAAVKIFGKQEHAAWAALS